MPIVDEMNVRRVKTFPRPNRFGIEIVDYQAFKKDGIKQPVNCCSNFAGEISLYIVHGNNRYFHTVSRNNPIRAKLIEKVFKGSLPFQTFLR